MKNTIVKATRVPMKNMASRHVKTFIGIFMPVKFVVQLLIENPLNGDFFPFLSLFCFYDIFSKYRRFFAQCLRVEVEKILTQFLKRKIFTVFTNSRQQEILVVATS